MENLQRPDTMLTLFFHAPPSLSEVKSALESVFPGIALTPSVSGNEWIVQDLPEAFRPALVAGILICPTDVSGHPVDDSVMPWELAFVHEVAVDGEDGVIPVAMAMVHELSKIGPVAAFIRDDDSAPLSLL